MSRFWRRSAESRAVTTVPWIAGGSAGSYVSQEKALGLNPVFAAIRHIVDYGSTTPLKGYREAGEERQPTNKLPALFQTMKSRGELIPWLSQGLSSLAIRGNAVGLIAATDGFGFPTNIEWVSLDRVSVDDTTGAGQWFIDGRRVSRLDIVHVPWIKVPGRTLALSPIEYYAATVTAGTAAQAYGSDWFNTGFPPSVFKNLKREVTAEQAKAVRARLVSSLKRREPLVTGSDWEFTPITIPPEQAQFIESQKLSANQVAAIYGIDPTEVGGEAANSLTYTTEELRQINRAANMQPYLLKFEHAFASWLPERQYVKFNTDAKIRADLKTRWEVNQIRLDVGAANVDEIRAQEDQPPLPNGQGQQYGPTPAPVSEPPQEPSQPPKLKAVRQRKEAHYE